MKWQMCVLTCALACALERLETLCKLQKVGTPLGLLCGGEPRKEPVLPAGGMPEGSSEVAA